MPFNGKEKYDEIKGNGSSIEFDARTIEGS